jgi:two-component system, cell cycle response regulator
MRMKQTSTVLIVDDQKFGREALQVALESEGYHLVPASSGPEALELAAGIRPDVVLLDVMMPDMDGFEVCRRMRQDPLLSEVPVILVTALDDRQSRIEGIEAGADDFVSKPFDRVELRARVRTITRLNRYRRLLLERTRFEWVVEHTDEGYLVVDGTDEIQYANPQARLYLGLAPNRAVPIAETFLSLAKARYRLEPQEIWAFWTDHPAFALRSPLYLVRPESQTSRALWLQVDVLDLDAQRGAGWLLRLRDVTSQIVLQRDMRSFHTLILHKLRTPLSHVLGSLQMLVEQLPASTQQNIVLNELARMALDGSERLHGQIEDVLQYLHAPTLSGPGSEVRTGEVVEAAQKIAGDLEMADVQVAIATEVGDAYMVLSRQALDLVLRELLENSHKFHPQHAPHVAIDVERGPEHMVRIRVSDNGQCLTPDQLSQAWQPYHQGEKDFTGEVQGMGLGLATVASVVWEAGGTCSLRNRLDGPGVVIELEVPLFEA